MRQIAPTDSRAAVIQKFEETIASVPWSKEIPVNHCGFSSVQAMSKFLDRMIHLTAYEYREGRSNGHRKK